MTPAEQSYVFKDELWKLINRFAAEFDLTYDMMIGNMQMVIIDLNTECNMVESDAAEIQIGESDEEYNDDDFDEDEETAY